MRYRTLGRTGIRISALAFGAGPVSGLMTGDDRDAQAETLQRAAVAGINWIDTAPGYGQGRSEANIGRVLKRIATREPMHVATKVRLGPDQLGAIRDAVRRSVEGSLERLGVASVTLLQLHNGLTARRGEEALTITPADVLGRGGVLDAFRELRDAGLIRFLGLTGAGHAEAMRDVIRSGGFDTIQTPYHLLNPSAGEVMPASFAETNFGNIIADCAALDMGVLAIRVFAGGALLGREPSAHTLTTPFFPLALYERDRQRAAAISGDNESLKERALRFVLDDQRIAGAIIGFGAAAEVDDLAALAERLTR